MKKIEKCCDFYPENFKFCAVKKIVHLFTEVKMIFKSWIIVWYKSNRRQSLLNCLPCVPACQRANVVYGPTCLRASAVLVPTCLRASVVYVPVCLRVNVPKACELLIFRCQRANERANVPCVPVFHFEVLIFQLGVPTCPKPCQFFKHFSYEMLREISVIYFCIKNSTLYWISYLYCT